MKDIQLNDNEFLFLKNLLSTVVKITPKCKLTNDKKFVDFLKKFEIYL